VAAAAAYFSQRTPDYGLPRPKKAMWIGTTLHIHRD
jgi:hypothetical protein